jgi:hypothetical protein
LKGAKDGVPFTSTNQPSGEIKSAGQQKRKFSRQMLKEMLDMQYKAKAPIKKELVAAFGPEIEGMTIGQIMGLRQMQKAVNACDSNAFTAVLNQALGQPKQETEITEKKIVVSRKLISSEGS